MIEADQQAPTVTALVLVRNGADELRRCLQSLLQSTGGLALDILVVDNGSTDNARHVPAEFPAVNTLRLPKNFGSTRALNIGLRTAKGEYILLISPTFFVEPETVSRLHQQLTAEPDIGAVCPHTPAWYGFPDQREWSKWIEAGSVTDPRPVPPGKDAVLVEYPAGAPILLRRLFLLSMNYFDERYGNFWWDLELCWQLRHAGKRILVLPDVPVHGTAAPLSVADPISAADFAGGAARFVGKHQGFGPGLRLRLGALLQSAGRILTFQSPNFHWKRGAALLTGGKVDGTQN